MPRRDRAAAGPRPLAVFDLFGTLAEVAIAGPQPVPAALAHRVGCPPDQVHGVLVDLLDELGQRASEDGERQPPAWDVADDFRRRRSLPGGRADWMELAWAAMGGDSVPFLRPAPGGTELLRALRRAGVVVAVLSNTQLPGELVTRALGRSGLLGELDLVVLSSQSGWRKPHSAAFAYLEGAVAAGHGPVAAKLMIGDNDAVDLVPAARLGYRAIRATVDTLAGLRAEDLVAVGAPGSER
jgi:FMN phosphatase YigB (HAD superfamily)